MKKILIAAVLFLPLLVTGAIAQTARKASAGRAPARVAEGVLYFVGSGNRITDCILKTGQGFVEFSVTEKTQMKGFHPQAQDDEAWELGAGWRVSYRDGGKDTGPVAESVTYTGKTESIAGAQKAAYDYLSFLADGNFKEAYGLLAPQTREELNFNAFTKLYKDVSVDMRGRIICSHTDDAVELLLAPHGSDGGDLFQRAEIVRINDKWSIRRLDAFAETPAGCGSLK